MEFLKLYAERNFLIYNNGAMIKIFFLCKNLYFTIKTHCYDKKNSE